MNEQIKTLFSENISGIVLFLICFVLVFTSRSIRLHGSDAISAAEGTEILLDEPTDLNGLLQVFSENSVSVNNAELEWATSILGWRNFNPGRYEISGNHSYDSILSKIARGLEDHVSVTVPPGLDAGRLSRVLASQLRADSVEFSVIFSDSSALSKENGLTGNQLFSRMLPDTYNIYWTTSADRVVRRILNEFERRVLNEYEDDISNHPFTLDEILTLASITEWEASDREEKPVISGLYLNRLERNMYLQADPTVIYALGERRRLLYEDYDYEHPFNTYQNPGLPPGPITNPDLASIESVLNPSSHNYLYMVANSEGGHVFSETYEEHLRASELWREWINEQYRIRDANNAAANSLPN